MKKVFGLTFGSLQKKVVNLVIAVLLVLVVLFTGISVFQNRMLTDLVDETRQEQQEAISRISGQTMIRTLEESFVRTTRLQADIADSEFSEVVNNVRMLQSMAEGLLTDRNSLSPQEYSLPDPEKDGTVSAMVMFEEGVDYTQSEYLGYAAHMQGPMTAMVANSEKINGAYIGLSDGTFFAADDETKDKYDADGNLIPFPVRQRPWYLGALETGDLYFTGIIRDAFSNDLCVTCSAPVNVNGQTVGVVGADIVLESMSEFIESAEIGHVFVVNDSGQIILSNDSEMFDQGGSGAVDLRESSGELGAFITKALSEPTDLTEISVKDRQYYFAGAPMPAIGWAVVSAIEKEITEGPALQLLSEYDAINETASETFRKGTAGSTRSSVLFFLLAVIAASYAALAAARNIARPIGKITRDVNRASMMNEPFVMKDEYRTNDEIEVLAEAFSHLSEETQKYIADITQITREKERVSTELHMANRIQNSMLPSVFPPFPERNEFDIYASMDPAREVGGDFYEFFLIDDDHLCMVMADVSGKGVPAALFMMISKVILQNSAMLGKSASEILRVTNDAICSSNQEDMFVTVWVGIMEISTGIVSAANAGHEYPVLMKNGEFSVMKDTHGFVIGGMRGMKYKEYEFRMEPGDKLFLYTDGIPESVNEANEMFGVKRLLNALNQAPDAEPAKIVQSVQRTVEGFVQQAEQFDDMTMLCMEYKGPSGQKEA